MDSLRIAELVLAELDQAGLLMLLVNEIDDLKREATKQMEHAAFASALREQFAAGDIPAPIAGSSSEAFAALFDKSFKLGDGTEATWGEATVEQHEQRLAMLTKLRDGLNSTIDRHTEAIHVLRTSGARCLAEVPQSVAA